MVSTYINFGKKLQDKKLLDILKEIKSGKFRHEINAIRYAIRTGKEKLADEMKKKLLAFTPSGRYGDQRKAESLTFYSCFICLDYDHIPISEIDSLLCKINGCPFTMASFISPRGEGVKVLVKIDSSEKKHPIAYDQVANYYNNITGYDCDPKCKDITRLCFVSDDPNSFINEDSDIFQIEEANSLKNSTYNKSERLSYRSDEILDECLRFTERKEQYKKGNRNNFIFSFANNANRFGIQEEDSILYCLTNFDLGENEIKTAVKSAYENHSADFAKFADFAVINLCNKNKVRRLVIEDVVEDEDKYLISTPTIPKSVYDNLPFILKQGCDVFMDERERDTFLTGALTVLSGCMPNVSGLYGGRTVYPHIFSFILAPAASGKGALKSAKELADKYHREVLKNSLEKKKEYDKEMEAYKHEKKYKSKNDKSHDEIPEQPPFKVVFIPANTSNAKIIQHLQHNNGVGIICETEADTLGQTFKNDWGSYSDLLRKAFHHEQVSISRKLGDEYLEIDCPRLAVALSGTPKQVFNIISSAEDGLCSRFLYYIFKTKCKWIDPSPFGDNINLSEHFQNLSGIVYEMVLFLDSGAETTIQLSEKQWEKFNPTFKKHLHQISTFVGDDAQSIVKRLGLILYRFCMIFTTLRKFNEKNLATIVHCLDEDFEIALTLIEIYLKHSIVMFNNLPKQEEQSPFKSGANKKLLFDAFPKRFTRKEAIDFGLKFNVKERTVASLLRACLGTYLTQPEYGIYEKINAVG